MPPVLDQADDQPWRLLDGLLADRRAARNRGADEWFVCGELFGLIAVIAASLLSRLAPRA